MANEISHRHSATGETLYFTIRNTARQMWNTAGTPNFETLTVANWGDYDVAMSESPASSYFFAGTFPAISGNMVAGWYWVDVFKRAGGSPAISDALQASYFGYWDGTTFKWWADDTVALAGGVQSATDLKDFADDGYDPSTNKVQGVANVDTLTTYSGNTPQTGDAYARLGANGAGLTSLGDTRLANLDAAVSSRSTYAGADTSGTTTLLSRLSSARAGYLDNLSAGAVALASQILDAAGIRTALGMASANLDTQIGLLATAAALSTVAGYIDTEVAAIKAKTDNLPTDPADASDIAALLSAISAYIDTEVAAILAAVDTEVAAIKAKTDNLPASPAAVGSAMTLGTDAVTAAAIATAAANKIADILLRRATSNIEASSDGESLSLKSLYGAAAMMTHPKDASSGTSLVLKKADGTTTLATIPIDTDAAADPIVGTS